MGPGHPGRYLVFAFFIVYDFNEDGKSGSCGEDGSIGYVKNEKSRVAGEVNHPAPYWMG